jgi:glycosyltransferase involved in cell wall biosynthesis
MRVVMGGESLEGQQTGIGQYTYHLADEMLKRVEIDDFKFLNHGVLKPAASIMANCMSNTDNIVDNEHARIKLRLFGNMRSAAAQNQLLVRMYEHLMPVLERRSLRNYGKNDIYHSPNYMLPTFPGRRVVSILDLSTYRHPEHHPKARVGFVNRHIGKAIEAADHILTISNHVRNEIIERFNYPAEQITTTYLGANNSFQPLPEKKFSEKTAQLNLPYKGYFLFVSSIEPRKNLDRLLDAYLAYRTIANSNAMPLIITGIPGWGSEKTHQRLQLLREQGSVNYLGYVDQQLIPALVSGARALLYPSLYEGFGLPVLEAMQSGTAVMTSEKSSMAEFSGNSVLLVNPLDIDAMADLIETLANNDQLLQKLEHSGIKTAKQFSWERCADETLLAYQALAA